MATRIVRLPDDPRCSPEAARKRAVRDSKAWKRKRFTPRSVHDRHQHHLITVS